MTPVRDHEALLALLERRARRRFSWRRWDCVRFAAAAVKAATGRDMLGSLRWSSMRNAAAILADEGGLQAAVDRRLTPIAPALAARGDVAGVPDQRFGIRLMIVEGRTLVGVGAAGLERCPRAAMTLAWSADANDPSAWADA